MTFWKKYIKPVPFPSPLIVLLDIFLILLAIFVIRTDFAYFQGIKSIALPVLDKPKIVPSEKHIVMLSELNGKFIYRLNDKKEVSLQELESEIRKELKVKQQNAGAKTRTFVLLAEKDIPYSELVNFYAMARKCEVNEVILATGVSRPQEQMMSLSSE